MARTPVEIGQAFHKADSALVVWTVDSFNEITEPMHARLTRLDELGQVKQGPLADLLLVDGDPLADVDILQDRDRLLAIMKDGVFHKEPLREASSVTLAAE